MHLSRLLSVAACLTLLASQYLYATEIQTDTINIALSGPLEKTTDSIKPSENKPVQVPAIGRHNRPSSGIMPIHTRLDSSKKNLTVVNNSNEFSSSTYTDPNPLLSAICLYDPMMYRVWPREPKPFFGDNLVDSIQMKPLFLPLVFSLYSPDYSLSTNKEEKADNLLTTPAFESLMSVLNQMYEWDRYELDVMQRIESNQIRYVDYRKTDLPDADPLIFILTQEKPMLLEKPSLMMIDQVTKREYKYAGVEYNPWTRRGNFKLHFSETYLSSNWSKGGESNMAGLATLFLEANYNNIKNIQFDNSLELKIGLNTVSTDTLRNLNVSTDQLRALTKLGIKMRDNWYYSLSSEFVTQTLNNYKKNTTKLLSSFMSPAKLFISLGVDFKKNDKKKGYNLSVMISPITYKANYLYDNINLNPKSYGIDPGKHFGSEVGSKVSSTITWKFSDRVNWKSKIYYFSDYTYVDSEWENTFDFSLNNYFSTQFYLYAKLDDRLKRKPGESLIQVQQLLSFGMTYRF